MSWQWRARTPNLQLVPDGAAAVGDVEQIAGVGVPRDQAQGAALAGAADQDRRVETLRRAGTAHRPAEAVVAALERRRAPPTCG
jgi:hypothetical protein